MDDRRIRVYNALAERLESMRRIDGLPEAERERMLSQAMELFIPLAHRLGFYWIKSEMENIWLSKVHPVEYNDIASRTDAMLTGRARELDDFIEPIADALLQQDYRFAIKKRIKTPYSIWYKMNTKHVTFEEIYDLLAVRFIYAPDTDDIEEERAQAYAICSTVTSIYPPMEGRFRDWVSHPKENGYEALHTTVLSKSGLWVEVQVRSRRMDDIAEHGIAAHWAYKNAAFISEADSRLDRWLTREIESVLINTDSDETDKI